jgi:hypothetical protein
MMLRGAIARLGNMTDVNHLQKIRPWESAKVKPVGLVTGRIDNESRYFPNHL